MHRDVSVALVALSLGFASATHALADEPSISFKGKQITMIVGTSPGGGYDMFTRTIAPHFARHLPGEPSVIVQNMPGAGSLTLMNHLYNVAIRDGTVIGAVNPDVVTEPLMAPGRAKFDSLRMGWIGSALRETNLSVAWHTSPVRTFDDLFEHELIVASTGGGTEVFPTFVNALLGARFKIVRGYAGLKEGMLAMERGEVTGSGSITWASLKATNGDWLRDGKLRLLVQYGAARHVELPMVPWIYDYARSDADRAAMNLVFIRQEYGRPYVAPPGLAPALISVLRRTFDATMQDPAFLADAKRHQLDIDPITGEQLDSLIAGLYKTPPDVLARVKGIIGADR